MRTVILALLVATLSACPKPCLPPLIDQHGRCEVPCDAGSCTSMLDVESDEAEAGSADRVDALDADASIAFTQITAGTEFTCAVTTNHQVSCWGSGDHGALGNGTTEDRLVPGTLAVGVFGFSAVSAGQGHTCGLLMDSSVVCWGSAKHAELGDGSHADRLAPGTAAILSGVRQLASGRCALKNDGSVWCWGLDDLGQTGDTGNADSSCNGTPCRLSPERLVSPGGVSFVGASTFTACAIDASEQAFCWGNNSVAQIGDGSMTTTADPRAALGFESFVGVAVGESNTCGFLGTGSAHCWGSNVSGQCGSAPSASLILTPGPNLPGLDHVAEMALGIDFGCARTMTGAVLCWGNNSNGQLGDGTTDPRSMPMAVSVPASVNIAAGAQHACSLSADGALYCWGKNNRGQVGDGTVMDRLRPVRVN